METRSTEYQTKWQSEFGNDYQTRNSIKKDDRHKIWITLLNKLGFINLTHELNDHGDATEWASNGSKNIKSALEVGCSRGHNLHAIRQATGADVVGIEINEKAIKERYVNSIVRGSAYDLPFVDGQFDLVYTAGVLIHLSDTDKAMKEIYRVSSQYILSIEYFDDKDREISYRNDVFCAARDWPKLWTAMGCKVLAHGKMSEIGSTPQGDDFARLCHYTLVQK
jgi:SAM-dependent methyltransferase